MKTIPVNNTERNNDNITAATPSLISENKPNNIQKVNQVIIKRIVQQSSGKSLSKNLLTNSKTASRFIVIPP